ncbi:unnamed protein product [Mycena citricolor]|uniref:Protein scd2/ral3 n=1 Tax=Mycena citricolor TaxID=2018698 RepID=A0AAD2JUH3_9AGAR|nr:unnamed protein product [Mycena citricolor]CAK5262770.1 unnamed protein product [Mycena citricolor]CAK5275799.1 unnamed protein product [Mycena citricolor]
MNVRYVCSEAVQPIYIVVCLTSSSNCTTCTAGALMKGLRKSLNGHKDGGVRAQISTPVPLPSVSRPPAAIMPPQKVIRAMSGYRPQAPQELPFQKGDFFHVLRDEEQGSYYEAHNPISGARGLVPKALFEEFNKDSAATRNVSAPGQRATIGRPPSQAKPPLKSQVFYAIVQHDFFAERADELEAKRGDAITVVAQSNREWFVAKPIGRIGRPGLIPVSFVEIHDPSTGQAIQDVNSLMDRGDLPKVEDWKKAMFNYKQNSIALGVVDAPPSSSSPRDSAPSSPYLTQKTQIAPISSEATIAPPASELMDPSSTETADIQPEGLLLSANVVSFHFEMEEYWFRIDAVYQPYAAPGRALPSAKSLILFRVYNDFYDFQVSLLNEFPREAGRNPPHPRILPFMPGPAEDVDDALTATRRAELDEYVIGLRDLSSVGGRYVLEHSIVREFLAIKPGDMETALPPRVDELEAILAAGEDGDDELQDSLGRLRVDERQTVHSDGSDYEDDNFGQNPYGQLSGRRTPDSSLRVQAMTNNHRRTGSNSSQNQPYGRSDSISPPPTRWAEASNNNRPVMPTSPSSSSLHSNSMSSRSRSGSVANANSPSISAANPQTAFVKIKIFDRVADDLIAIRVHPRVTHMELMDKVQHRLGGEVAQLKYRQSLSNELVELGNDQQLRAWIDGTDKHVLYAE